MTEPWWHPDSIPSGEGRRWQIGPLELWTYHFDGEWQIAYRSLEDETLEAAPWSSGRVTAMSEELPQIERFAAGAEVDQVSLQPRMADRSVVARPRVPFHVLPGQAAKLYVSTPLWIAVRVGRAGRCLREIPTKRLSDTWFGSTTREGELAYSLKTHARVRLAEMPVRAYRAITPVVFDNAGDDVLEVDRMNLPVPYISLYANQDGQLWTQAVTLTRHQDSELANLDVKKGPPEEAGTATRVSDARLKADASVVVRAFSSLLRSFGEETA